MMDLNAVPGFLELKNHIETMAEIQEILMDIIDSEEEDSFGKISLLFSYFDKIDIKTDFMIYESTLNLLLHASSIRPANPFVCPKLQKILTFLIENHEMRTVFPPMTIFSIFQRNMPLLLCLYKQKVIDISHIINDVKVHCNLLTFIYFFPEIDKADHLFFLECVQMFFSGRYDTFGLQYDQKSDNYLLIIQSNDYLSHDIAKIIQNDDIDSFVQFISEIEHSQREEFDLNINIKPSIFDTNEDIVNVGNGVSLLEYSMIFGSSKIFRYLWLQNVQYTRKSLKNCVIGGNYDIIHILEEESNIKFNEECLYTAIKYYKQDIKTYFINTLNLDFNVSKENLVKQYLSSLDFVNLNQMMNSEDADEYIENSQIIVRSIILSFMNYKLFLFYYFALQQSNVILTSTDLVIHYHLSLQL